MVDFASVAIGWKDEVASSLFWIVHAPIKKFHDWRLGFERLILRPWKRKERFELMMVACWRGWKLGIPTVD